MEKTINMTETEAIEFTTFKGCDGEEFETQAWKRGGCLKKDGTYKKLIRKLECHFEKVNVVGSGKSKVYILTNPKAEPTVMPDKRKGRKMPRKLEDEILTNFVHRVLIKLKPEDLHATTYNALRIKIPFVFNQSEKLAGIVAKVFNDYLSREKLKDVWSFTDWYLNDRATKDIMLAIEHLAEDKKIEVKIMWIASSYLTELKSQISLSEVEKINEAIRQLAIETDIDYQEYQRSFAFPFKSKKMSDFQMIVESYLQENFGYNFIYKAMEINVLDFASNNDWNYSEVKEVFLTKVRSLVSEKVKSPKYLKAQNKGEKFHYLCVLLFLRENGIQIDEQKLKEEIEGIPYHLHEIVKSFEEPKQEGFGRKITY